jgi:hypothetical protein
MVGALAIAILPKHSPLVDRKVSLGETGKITV